MAFINQFAEKVEKVVSQQGAQREAASPVSNDGRGLKLHHAEELALAPFGFARQQ